MRTFILKSQNDTQKNIVYLDEMKDLVDAFRDIINSWVKY